jgi:hypothetical protein
MEVGPMNQPLRDTPADIAYIKLLLAATSMQYTLGYK